MKEIMAVDGTGASGKSVCAEVAKKLGYGLLETGAIYRMITLMILKARIDPNNTALVESFVRQNHVHLSFSGNKLLFDGKVVGDEIRTSEVGVATPKIAKQPAIRKLVVPLQRSFNGGSHIVAEGRDIGSVIFPDARVKIFLTADLEVRAMRRLKQYVEKDPSYAGTLTEEMDKLRARDEEDMARPDSPLVCLPDAVFIDSTFLTKEQVVERMLHAYKSI